MFEDLPILRPRRSSKRRSRRRPPARRHSARRGRARSNIGTSAALLDDAVHRMAEAVTASPG